MLILGVCSKTTLLPSVSSTGVLEIAVWPAYVCDMLTVSWNFALKHGSSRQGMNDRASAGSKFVQKIELSSIVDFKAGSSIICKSARDLKFKDRNCSEY